VREVVKALESVSGTSLPVRVVGRRDGDSPVVVADGTRIKELLKWSPRYANLTPIIETMLHWEQAKPT
jgi:UDP-glucose 4-epimerase